MFVDDEMEKLDEILNCLKDENPKFINPKSMNLLHGKIGVINARVQLYHYKNK